MSAKFTHRVIVDGVDKGEVFQRNGRYHWRRGEIAVEPFGRGATLADVGDWARKCCNGTYVHFVVVKQPQETHEAPR